MIDTDKYEGHDLSTDEKMNDTIEYIQGSIFDDEDEGRIAEANAQLIADAPLLLEEVKRLRRQIKVAQGVFEHLYDDELEDASWIRWFCNMEDEEE